jgi:DNA invertase Pin-like site-specific DNA recombinase
MSGPKAYRYARFSHSTQAEGMSLERQADVAADWARQRGIDIDDTHAAFIDSGVSASRGKNLVKGALGRFREAVAAGDVAPGSYLLVESVSRFSRLSPLDSQPILRELVEAGIRVVFFDMSIEITAENLHSMQVGMVLSVMSYIAADYSNTLGKYGIKKWDHSRARMRQGFNATRMLPFWLRCEKLADGKRGPIEPHPVYAPIVERIYAEYLAGRGKAQIAKRLTNEGVPPPVRVGSDTRAQLWNHSLIGRVLANPAVTGLFQPHKEIKTRITLKSGIAGALKRKRQTAGDAIPGYYPRVISDETFAQAAAMREGNRAKAGAKLQGRAEALHILANLARCPVCDASMKREYKGDERYAARYVCSHALAGKAGACQRVRVPVAAVEKALIGAADSLGAGAPAADPAIGAELAQLEAQLTGERAKLTALTERLSDMIMNGEEISSAVNAAHTKLETRTGELAATLDSLRSKATAVQPNVLKLKLAAMVGALKGYAPGDPLGFEAPTVNAALFACFSRAVVDYRTGELVMHWRHGPPPSVVKFEK